MKNATKMKVPKKYQAAIKEIYRDYDGVWVILNDGFIAPSTGCQTIHEDRQIDALACIREITVIK